MSGDFEVLLSGGVDAGWLARRAIAANAQLVPPSVKDDVLLLVTELVTNAVRHGGGERERSIKVDVRPRADRIRVEVLDPGTEFEPPTALSAGDSSGGWGLYLVDRIADCWGVRATPSGTGVWFEIPAGASR